MTEHHKKAGHREQEVVNQEPQKVEVSPEMERLTAEEIEALRKDMREAMAYYQKIWGGTKST